MTAPFVLLHNVTFAHETASEPILRGLSVHFSRGWTGVVGPNGAGKSTLLQLAAGILTPQEGVIEAPGSALYCAQRTDILPDRLTDLLHATDGNARILKDRLGLSEDWADRWTTLSHGERKRAQIAAALWQEPDVLALDEPTNHLDSDARALLATALQAYPGAGILVSHDRALLDALCDQCLFLDPPDAVLRPGTYSEGMEQARQNGLAAERKRESTRNDLAKLRREATRRREEASRADRRRSKKGLDAKDHDTRAKINLARVSGKDGVAGKQLRQLEGRLTQAQARLEEITVRKTLALGIWMPGARSERNLLFRLPAGTIALGDGRVLEHPDLVMSPADRIALTGPNGTGKSTLISKIFGTLTLPEDRVVCIRQEVDIDASRGILAEVRGLPRAKLGRLLTIVSRLGSRADRLLETDEPSPGEVRKLLLALGILREPHLIIMDEPTNHLDLPSIECLEDALEDCPCGLFLISHDQRFLDVLTTIRWSIAVDIRKAERLFLRT